MSGGSWDYISFRIEEVADRLLSERDPLRGAFGNHMKLVAHALHEIEWVDSGDSSSPVDEIAIRAVFDDSAKSSREAELSVLLSDAKKIKDDLESMIGYVENSLGAVNGDGNSDAN